MLSHENDEDGIGNESEIEQGWFFMSLRERINSNENGVRTILLS